MLLRRDLSNSTNMTSTTSYLEQYLDSLENLPSELKKNFTNMHELDARNKDILVEIDTASDDYLRAVRDLSPPKRKAEMEKIQVGKYWSSDTTLLFCSIVFEIIVSRNIKLLCVPLNITLSYNSQGTIVTREVMSRGRGSSLLSFKSFLYKFPLQRMFKKSKEISDDKVNIAVHTYELVDKHIRKLDADLAKFESEMKVKFVLLTTEARDTKQSVNYQHILNRGKLILDTKLGTIDRRDREGES